jgi:hypothetical protein
MKNALEENNSMVLFSGFKTIDGHGRIMPESLNMTHQTPNMLRNIFNILLGKGKYWGCTALFNTKILDILLPFPASVESHDLWLAKVGIMTRSLCHFHEDTLLHRLHDKNLTPKKRRTVFKRLKTRVFFLMSIFIIYKRNYSRDSSSNVKKTSEPN